MTAAVRCEKTPNRGVLMGSMTAAGSPLHAAPAILRENTRKYCDLRAVLAVEGPHTPRLSRQ